MTALHKAIEKAQPTAKQLLLRVQIGDKKLSVSYSVEGKKVFVTGSEIDSKPYRLRLADGLLLYEKYIG